MSEIAIRLNGCCIQEGARRLYEKSVRRCLGQALGHPISLELENRLLGLTCFLENADFAALRAAYPLLDGRHDICVVLHSHDPAAQNPLMRLVHENHSFPVPWKS